MRYLASYAAIITSLTACGAIRSGSGNASSATTEQSPQQPSWPKLVQTRQELPSCNLTSEGLLVYLASESQFAVCQSGSWQSIDLKGPKGADGGKKLTIVKDKNGKKVGYYIEPTSITDARLPVLLLNGLLVRVRLESGCVSLFNTAGDATAIYFADTSCNPTAGLRFAKPNSVGVEGYLATNQLNDYCQDLWVSGNKDLGPFIFKSENSYSYHDNTFRCWAQNNGTGFYTIPSSFEASKLVLEAPLMLDVE